MTKRWTLLAGLAAIALTPLSAPARGQEAVPAGQVGLDMTLTDPDGMPAEPEYAPDELAAVQFTEWSGAAADLAGVPVHHLYTDLRRASVRYQLSWGALPQFTIPRTDPIEPGSTNASVMALRQRLGFEPAGFFDEAVAAKLRSFQAVHALKVDGLAGSETLAALNRGAAYYQRVILLNMERARRLPAPGTGTRFIVVDAGAAMLTMYDGGQIAGSMKVVVGAPASQTPMIATQLRYAAVNPYWNVPPDLVAKLIAPKVLAQGRSYLVDRRYEVLSDWTDTATPVEPEAVNWQAVATSSEELRVRQLPGGANSMGRIKFLMPNQYGIYLHDTPNRALFGQDDRCVSNGCVRLEDADALARFVFGTVPTSKDPDKENRVDVDKPVPVYMTYLTAAASIDGVQFRRDPYSRDPDVLVAMSRTMGSLPALASADVPADPLAASFKDDPFVDALAAEVASLPAKPSAARKVRPAYVKPVNLPAAIRIQAPVVSRSRSIGKAANASKAKAVVGRPVASSATKLTAKKRGSAKATPVTKPRATASKPARKKTIAKPS